MSWSSASTSSCHLRRALRARENDQAGHRPITLPHDKGGGGYPIGLTMATMRQAGLKGGDE
jgi:hypothetical protein